MKSTLCALLTGVIALFGFNTAHAFSTNSMPVKPATAIIPTDPNPLSHISAKQFLTLTPKKWQEMTGKKLTLMQKIQFKMLQHDIKKMVKRGEVVTMADVQKKYEDIGTMNVLGFLLGLVLGPIGVIIALILKETGDVDASVLRWSLYGLLVWLAIVLLVILL
jgi:hypothetical protein